LERKQQKQQKQRNSETAKRQIGNAIFSSFEKDSKQTCQVERL
jgi:hypothetical protein